MVEYREVINNGLWNNNRNAHVTYQIQPLPMMAISAI